MGSYQLRVLIKQGQDGVDAGGGWKGAFIASTRSRGINQCTPHPIRAIKNALNKPRAQIDGFLRNSPLNSRFDDLNV